jgi:nucleotide-binding universal stress UspA family protein
MQRILAATDFSMRSRRSVRRAGLLARRAGAELTILHVVDDDQPAHLIELERNEAGKILEQRLGSIDELREISCRIVVATGDAFDMILRAAESISADLIVMGAYRKQLLQDYFVGTTVERVVRRSGRPVLMVNKDVEGPYRRVLAAVDMSDASVHAVQSARTLGFFDNAQISIGHAFQPLAKSTLVMVGAAQDGIDAHVAQEHLRASQELDAFLKSHGIGDPAWTLRIEEGDPFPTIARLVTEMYPDLLVIGTHNRTGIAKMLLGSVAEEALRALDLDILTVPPMAVASR